MTTEPAEHGQERAWAIVVAERDKRAECVRERNQLMADKRVLVEAGNNVISDLERQGSVTSAHYNTLRAALDRIQEGR